MTQKTGSSSPCSLYCCLNVFFLICLFFSFHSLLLCFFHVHSLHSNRLHSILITSVCILLIPPTLNFLHFQTFHFHFFTHSDILIYHCILSVHAPPPLTPSSYRVTLVQRVAAFLKCIEKFYIVLCLVAAVSDADVQLPPFLQQQ